MRLFGRVMGAISGTIDDPVLGKLKRIDDHWSGRATWPHSKGPFALSVHRIGPPHPADRAVYEQLKRDFPSLRAAIEGGLFDLWTRYRGASGEAVPDFASSLSLWSNLGLQGVSLHEDGQVELIFGFIEDNAPEGAFVVAVRGRQVEPLEYVE